MIRILILITLTVLVGNASAEIIDISFPELTGDFETGWLPPDAAPVSRSTTFMFPPDLQSMNGLRLVLTGAWVKGVVVCINPIDGLPDTTGFTPELTMFLKAPEVFDGFFHATVQPPNGSFAQWSATFAYCCPTGSGSPNLLLGAVISAELFCGQMLLLPCHVDVDSYGTLADVRLEAFGAVPVDEFSWGSVKSLYR